jgi:hypothetical protein
LLDLFAASAGDFLDGWFESAPIKAAFGFDSVVGNYTSRAMLERRGIEVDMIDLYADYRGCWRAYASRRNSGNARRPSY